jgi:hypothetical protein
MFPRLLVLCCVLLPGSAAAQAGVTLAAAVSPFLPDSADRAPRVDWTTGAALPIRWASPGPVDAPYLRAEGMSHRREGTIRLAGSDGPIDGLIVTQGVPTLVMQVAFTWDMEAMVVDSALAGLERAGVGLRPLKCDRAKEGYSYGNAVYTMRIAGKRPQGLHMSWNCGAAVGCSATLTILYRRADVERVECAGA